MGMGVRRPAAVNEIVCEEAAAETVDGGSQELLMWSPHRWARTSNM